MRRCARRREYGKVESIHPFSSRLSMSGCSDSRASSPDSQMGVPSVCPGSTPSVSQSVMPASPSEGGTQGHPYLLPEALRPAPLGVEEYGPKSRAIFLILSLVPGVSSIFWQQSFGDGYGGQKYCMHTQKKRKREVGYRKRNVREMLLLIHKHTNAHSLSHFTTSVFTIKQLNMINTK